MCSAATVYSSIKASGLRAGQWAVFPGGGGGVGSQGLQFAVAMGFRTICVDTGDARREMALSIGVEHFIDFKEEDAVAEVLRLTREGAHAVFVTGKSLLHSPPAVYQISTNTSKRSSLILRLWAISALAWEQRSCGKLTACEGHRESQY